MNSSAAKETNIRNNRAVDLRSTPCSEKHPLILRTWLALPVGDQFVFVNGHEPLGLYRQFSEQWPGSFAWECLARGPEEFQVTITKLRNVVSVDLAPPGCCGH